MMYLLNKKFTFLAGLTLCFAVIGHTQTVTSIRDGLWTDPSIWDTGQVPTLATASETVINHAVILPTASVISIQNAVVNNSFTLEAGAIVNLIADGLPLKRDLQVFGTLVLQDGSTLNGTSVSNTSFESGSRYVHLQGPLGFIPYATWDANSTFEIAGFKTQGYINIAHSDSWKQMFGNVIYNCTQQATAFVDLNGYLRSIAGNFIVQSTNNQALRLSTTQNPVINIGGDFIIEGPSKLWFSTNPTNAIVTVQKDFRYRSSSTGISYLTTKGVITVNVHGEMQMNSGGRFHMASTSPDSTGARVATLSLRGNLTVNAGSIVGPPLPGKGKINFVGPGIQSVTTPISGSPFQGTLDYLIESGSTLTMKNSIISNSAGALVVKGKLQLGSTHPGGAIQLTNAGNIQVQGARTFEAGCTIEYNGTAEQWIGPGHPSTPGTHLICSNPAGVTMLNGIVANDVTISSKFSSQLFSLTAHGNISLTPGIECSIEQVNLQGGIPQQISAANAIFKKIIIDKTANNVIITTPLRVTESLVINSTNTTLNSNGHLTLLSTSDFGSSTASVGPLPTGSSIDGDVTVNRHMAGEGRIYRYIASPVQNSTVASLKDDFPITGTFADPSTGQGIRSTSPSFFYYDESIGSLQEGWLPYPTSGLAGSNPLTIGKGYAAFIRNGTSSTIWDITGKLNQGTIELPVNFTPNNEPSNGWNLVGNPYACAIQWDQAGVDKWTIENISSVIVIRDNGAGGVFRYWDMDDNYSTIPGGQIASGQSFWVRATAENPKLVIREGVKVLGGATFFRKDRSDIPSLALELSRDSIRDVAYFKIRSNSKPRLDNWDGVKLDNDNFDISFISADNKSLAISATDKFPCDTIIQIGFKDLMPGWYKLRLSAKHDFLRYQCFLRDRFLHTETLVSDNETIPLVVTADPASFAFDRIALRLVERKVNDSIEVSGDQEACIGSVVKLTIRNADPYVAYSVWSGGKQLSMARSEKTGDLDLIFQADSLSQGPHVLSFQAQSSCYIETSSGSHPINISTAPHVLIASDTVCAGSSSTLTAFSDQRDVTFHWFSDKDSNDTLSTGYSFETPALVKPLTYYVSATGKWGCSSERFSVQVPVKTYREAVIRLLGDSLLTSNYATGNQWFLYDSLIENASRPILPPPDPGVYTLRVDTLGCVAQDTFTYIIARAEPKQTPLLAYPNPASDFIYIRHATGIRQVEIWDAAGKLVLVEAPNANGQDIPINIRKLRQGIYTAVIFSRQKKWIFRFVKLTG